MSAQISPRQAGPTASSDDDGNWTPPGSDDDVGSDAAEDFIRRHPSVVTFARIGWAAKGLVYMLTGVLAFTIVVDPFGSQRGAQGGGSNADQADPSGAVAKVAQQPFGEVLLWILAVGLFMYAIWRIVTVILPADVTGDSVIRRVGYVVSAVTYVVLGAAAVSLARRPGSSGGQDSQSQDSQITEVTRSVMEWSGGRWLVGIAGVVVVGIGAYFFWKGVSGSFENQLEHRAVGPFSWNVIRMMGRIGWIGRAAMMALIGVFVARAAYQFDPDEAGGLDDSLRRVADNSVGVILVVVVAVGLVAYGAYCIVSTPSRKLVASDEDTVAS
jgi:Domain of Unknown Function (DUF1206)